MAVFSLAEVFTCCFDLWKYTRIKVIVYKDSVRNIVPLSAIYHHANPKVSLSSGGK